jgi:acyl transferase domain-containing protein
LQNPAAFDARFFNLSPREAPQVDPAQRIALMTAYEAMERAGMVPNATASTAKDRVGVWYGVTSNDWMETNTAQNIDTYFIPGGNRAFIPGRLNYCFKFSGPSYAVDTACSSSLAAIHLACNALWRGEVDTAIAGGTNILTNPDFTAGLDRGHFLSRTGNCKTFDDSADGYCRGEGVGTVILKRLDDALADRDPICGVILSAGTNHSAEAESITRPHSGAQQDLIHNLLRTAGVSPYSVSYAEMHGTGTQAGDAGEMNSVLTTLAPPSVPYRTQDQPLYLGSAKANIGHGEAASGVSSLIKVMLMMEHNAIAPHCGIKTRINRKFPTDLEDRNVHIAKAPTPWTSQHGEPRRVLLNNFSAAGGNTALLLEDAPSLPEPEEAEDPRTCHILAVSAKCASSLEANVKSLLSYIEAAGDELSLPCLSYTTTARRMHHPHRVIVQGSTASDIQQQLKSALARGDGANRPSVAPKVVLAFTGQGSQFVGMARQLCSSLPPFRASLQQLDRIAQSLGFDSFLPFLEDDSGADLKRFSPMTAQLASVCLQIALARLWASLGVVPDAVVGHSLGEYAALNVAGVLSDADTVFLVGKRAQLLEEHCTLHTHSMLVARASVDTIKLALAEVEYEIACINAPEETVLAGPNDQFEALQHILSQLGVRSKTIPVSYAYHSSQVQPILDDLFQAAQPIVFNKPFIPVLSPLMGDVVQAVGTFGPEYLQRHCRETVNFYQAMQSARSAGVVTDRTQFVEIGPHGVVTGLIKACSKASQAHAVPTLQRGRDDWESLGQAMSALYRAGVDIAWNEYHRPFPAAQHVLRLPAYNWNLKNYWIQYVNDWSLRKGDPPLIQSARLGESTTIHKVVEETKDSIVVECDLSREDLVPIVKGHNVDGIPLCTPVSCLLSIPRDALLLLMLIFTSRYMRILP